MQVDREFTHERTKQCIDHLKVIASSPPQKPHLATPERSPRGQDLTRQVDQLFLQEQLRDLWITEPAFAQRTALLGGHPKTPNQEQYNSTWEDTKEDEGNATSLLDAELDASLDEEMDTSRCSHCSLLADRCCQRNHALCREHNRACQEFHKPRNWQLSLPLFRETTKEDAISYRDWCSEVEEALERGHDAAKVKEVIFASLEGWPRIMRKWLKRVATFT